MTKEKARERAKARAAGKTKKKETKADLPGQQSPVGKFDPGASSIKGPGKNANTRSFGGARRGAARSR